MDLSEVRRQKEIVQKKISAFIEDEMTRFRKNTDIEIREIHVNMIETTNIGSIKKEYSLANVEILLEEI